MKKRKGQLAKLLLCLLSVLLAWIGHTSFKQAKKADRQVTIMVDEDMAGAARSRYWDALERGCMVEETDYCVWQEKKDQTVSDKLSGRQKRVSVISFAGRTQLILPNAPVLYDSDQRGCLIDKQTARELIGDDHPIGAVLVIEEREWIIRGVFESPHALMFLPYVNTDRQKESGMAESDLWEQDNRKADCYRITIPEDTIRTAYQAAQKWMQQSGITGDMLRLDMLTQPAWIKELLPGKYSDLDAFASNLKRKERELYTLLKTEKTSLEMECICCRIKGTLCWLASLGNFMILTKSIDKKY